MYCLECACTLGHDVFYYSTHFFGIPLCRPHQNWLRQQEEISTFEALQFYFALKERGVPAVLEAFDGYKSVDIAIPEARIHIEIDGGHHHFSQKQALADLKRTYHSFLAGYLTLRLPNTLIHNHLDETADHVTEMLAVNRDRRQLQSYQLRKRNITN